MTTVVDWRDADVADVVPLVSAEAKVWLDLLHWDVSDAWHVIEPARQAGHLPGTLVFDRAGRPAGWSAYLRHADSLQVMALVAPDENSTAALVEAVLKSEEAVHSDTAIVCVRDASPGLSRALAAHGFAVEPYRYLRVDLNRVPSGLEEFDPWPESTEEVAALFGAAYAEQDTIRAFAPNGRAEEWLEYVSQLQKGPGCGWFQPDLSLACRAPEGALEAAILVTHLGPDTIHVAQLAVAPGARRRGLARKLVASALGRARGQYARATLLVSAANRAAGSLYESVGFEDVTRFVVATKRQPIRSTSLACSTGGASTRL